MCRREAVVDGDRDVPGLGERALRLGRALHRVRGAGEGDDETVKIELAKIPADLDKVVFAVTIHEAETRKQNFGQVNHAFIRVVNEENGQEIARYDLSEDASVETAMIFGEIYRIGTEWKFKAVGQGFAGGLGALAASFGVNI